MIQLKQHLKNSEKIDIYILLETIKDLYGDFYITRNNIRLFIKENLDSLFDLIQKGKIRFVLDKEGIAIITGYGNKDYNRKYIKILTKNESSADKLLKIINWHYKEELFSKLKKENSLLQIFYNNGFVFAGGRGKEILLIRNKLEAKNVNFNIKDKTESSNPRH